jgi:hypothetical protein
MSTDTIVLPDSEALVIGALAGMPELAELEGRLYSIVPKSPRVFPLARVYRFGGDPLYGGHPYWLDNPSMQVDVWADGGFPPLRSLAETVRACMAQKLVGEWPQGVVLSVLVSSLVQSADASFNPPKPRYRFTAQLLVRPLRAPLP